jgi:hypothetical protein
MIQKAKEMRERRSDGRRRRGPTILLLIMFCTFYLAFLSGSPWFSPCKGCSPRFTHDLELFLRVIAGLTYLFIVLQVLASVWMDSQIQLL